MSGTVFYLSNHPVDPGKMYIYVSVQKLHTEHNMPGESGTVFDVSNHPVNLGTMYIYLYRNYIQSITCQVSQVQCLMYQTTQSIQVQCTYNCTETTYRAEHARYSVSFINPSSPCRYICTETKYRA